MNNRDLQSFKQIFAQSHNHTSPILAFPNDKSIGLLRCRLRSCAHPYTLLQMNSKRLKQSFPHATSLTFNSHLHRSVHSMVFVWCLYFIPDNIVLRLLICF